MLAAPDTLGGYLPMCLTVAHHDLGPADALLDRAEHLLVLRPTLTPAQRRRAARGVLAEAGCPQSRVGVVVTCLCGHDLPVDPVSPVSEDRSKLATLGVTGTLAMLCVALLGGASPAAAADPFDRAEWRESMSILGATCEYEGRFATCEGLPLGLRYVSASRVEHGHVRYEATDARGRALVGHVFDSDHERAQWLVHHPGAVLSERFTAAYTGTPALVRAVDRALS